MPPPSAYQGVPAVPALPVIVIETNAQGGRNIFGQVRIQRFPGLRTLNPPVASLTGPVAVRLPPVVPYQIPYRSSGVIGAIRVVRSQAFHEAIFNAERVGAANAVPVARVVPPVVGPSLGGPLLIRFPLDQAVTVGPLSLSGNAGMVAQERFILGTGTAGVPTVLRGTGDTHIALFPGDPTSLRQTPGVPSTQARPPARATVTPRVGASVPGLGGVLQMGQVAPLIVNDLVGLFGGKPPFAVPAAPDPYAFVPAQHSVQMVDPLRAKPNIKQGAAAEQVLLDAIRRFQRPVAVQPAMSPNPVPVQPAMRPEPGLGLNAQQTPTGITPPGVMVPLSPARPQLSKPDLRGPQNAQVVGPGPVEVLTGILSDLRRAKSLDEQRRIIERAAIVVQVLDHNEHAKRFMLAVLDPRDP